MLNPHDPLQFKTNMEGVMKSDSNGKFVRRKAPADKTKRDFEKVLKSKDKKSEQETVLNRKKGVGNKSDDQKGHMADLEETPTGALFGGVASKEGMGSGEERLEFLNEQPDIAAVGVGSEIKSHVQAATPGIERADQAKQIKEIVDQIVHKVYTLKQEGKTDTILTLRHPPLFEGAQLRITAYDSARGEFNITFSQLSSQAKMMLDMARQDMQRKLEIAGYTTHIVVATTEKDDIVAAEQPEAFSRDEEGEKEQGQEENPREQNKEEG